MCSGSSKRAGMTGSERARSPQALRTIVRTLTSVMRKGGSCGFEQSSEMI